MGIGAGMRAMAVLAAVAAVGCGDDSSGGTTACTLDEQCSLGFVCDAGKCTQLACTTTGDCLNGDQGCIEVGGGNFCAAVDCGCPNCPLCPIGMVCDNGTCGNAAACSDTTPCTGTDVCDGGSCRPCEGAECPGADCTTAGCPSGQECNGETKQCQPITASADGCDTCTQASDCGGSGWKCAPLPTGNACLPPCSSGNDCETGWTCQSGNCTPVSFRCDGCVTAGCAGGQACNPSNNACIAATPSCGSCGNDWECGEGHACRGGECARRCDNGTCPDGGACTATASGVQVCQTACEEACTPACGGATPICEDGRCVQCRNAGDCSNGQQCDTASGLCTGGGECSGSTPILWQGTCVQCVSNDHCAQGQSCNQSTHTCVSGQCAACAAPYPACVQIGSDSYCVQCGTDEDCGLGGTCNTQTYACEGGTTTPTEKCTSDADCDAGASDFTLKCDVPSGYCYSVDGMCDDVTAFCVGSDGKVESCVSLLALFGGGMGGALPPDLSGGATIPGFCGCTTSLTAPLGNCRSGACIDLGALLALLGGGGSSPGTGPSAACWPL